MAECTLDRQTRNCWQECEKYGERCGWNQEEDKRRKQMIADNKLKICKDGLKRLIIKRKVSEE